MATLRFQVLLSGFSKIQQHWWCLLYQFYPAANKRGNDTNPSFAKIVFPAINRHFLRSENPSQPRLKTWYSAIDHMEFPRSSGRLDSSFSNWLFLISESHEACVGPFYISRIHGAGIYANIWGILMGSMLPYIAYMDPMGIYIYIFIAYVGTKSSRRISTKLVKPPFNMSIFLENRHLFGCCAFTNPNCSCGPYGLKIGD